jgi:alkylated DNA repair dioxygenase AlkB
MNDDNNNNNRIIHTPIVTYDTIEGSIVSLYENVLSWEESHQCLEELRTTIPFQIHTDSFGEQSRPTCYYGDDPTCIFTYVGLTLQPRPWPSLLLKLRRRVTDAVGRHYQQDDHNLSSLPSPLTACLVNLYPYGQGHIPWHYDEVRAHGPDKIVASLSLGGPRRFQLRRRRPPESIRNEETDNEEGELIFDHYLPSGSVLLMKGNTQHYYEHCLPGDGDLDPLRISLTFRSIVPGYERDKEIATDKCCVK